MRYLYALIVGLALVTGGFLGGYEAIETAYADWGDGDGGDGGGC